MAGLLDGIMPMFTSLIPGHSSGAGGAHASAGSESKSGGGLGIIGDFLDMLGLGDVLKGFGIGGAKDSGAGAKPKPKGAGATHDAARGATGGDVDNADAARLAAASLASASASSPAPAASPGRYQPRFQPRAQAGIEVGHGPLPSEMDIPVIPM